MFMRWNDLAFLHWPVDPGELRGRIPKPLELDTYNRQAWIGITPFWMSNVRGRCTPAIPRFSSFPELNVRTYVHLRDKPGIWFFSLDAANKLAVEAARRFYFLPYYDARTTIAPLSAGFHYFSTRSGRRGQAAVLDCRYWPTGDVYRAPLGSLDHWLTERYCLYTQDATARLNRTDIFHAPWPLQPGAAEITTNTMASACGIRLPDTPPLVHFARRQDVRATYLIPVA